MGDAETHKAKPGDKVVLEMLHFPTLDERGEGVISEVLGPHGAPGVDTLSILRQFEIPDRFAEDALEEARETAASFDETDLGKRDDLTDLLTVTIDPADAKDFDDAISLERDARSHHWLLSVHIADVAHFVPAGGPLDREARRRGTSVYLPGRVVPCCRADLQRPGQPAAATRSLSQDRADRLHPPVNPPTSASRKPPFACDKGCATEKCRHSWTSLTAPRTSTPRCELLLHARLALILHKRASARLARTVDARSPGRSHENGVVVAPTFANTASAISDRRIHARRQ